MKADAAKQLSERVRRFARWFFTATPEPVADPLTTLLPRSAAKPRRHDARHLRAQHTGRVKVSDGNR